LSHDHFNQFCLTKGKITRTFAPCGTIDTTKYFGSCATEWAVSDLDIGAHNLKFSDTVGYGVHEKISDPIRLQNFHIRTPLVATRDDHNPVCRLDIPQESQFKPDTDIQKLLSKGNRIRLSETLFSIFRGSRLLEKLAYSFSTIVHSEAVLPVWLFEAKFVIFGFFQLQWLLLFLKKAKSNLFFFG